jgi:hypothetical protein
VPSSKEDVPPVLGSKVGESTADVTVLDPLKRTFRKVPPDEFSSSWGEDRTTGVVVGVADGVSAISWPIGVVTRKTNHTPRISKSNKPTGRSTLWGSNDLWATKPALTASPG